MPDPKLSRKSWGRVAPGLLGLMLLAYLVRRAGPSRLLEGIASVGWGLVLVIALAGLSHVVRTWAWRLTLLDAGHRVSFGRMFALRLASEAAGQIGVFGQVFGDTWRVARLGAQVPLAARITSVALDRMLFTLSSTVVTFAGYRFGDLPVASARQGRSLREDFRDGARGACVPGGGRRATGGGR